MRIVLVGHPGDRERLQQTLADGPFDIVGEADTLAAARAIDDDVDAFLVAAPEHDARGRTEEDVPAEPLTAREIDVLELLAQGLPNKAIAVRLGISDQTVKFHVAAVCGKLGAANRTDAVRLAIRKGMVAV